MPEVHVKVTVDRPRDVVYDYMATAENQTVWNANLVEFDADWTDAPKKGDRSRGTVKVAGKRLEWTAEVTEAERPARFGFRSVEAPFPFEFTYTLTERDGATEVAYDGSSESMGGFFGKLADPIVARMYERDSKANLENLKAVLEGS